VTKSQATKAAIRADRAARAEREARDTLRTEGILPRRGDRE
jgi:hypothetical protein